MYKTRTWDLLSKKENDWVIVFLEKKIENHLVGCFLSAVPSRAALLGLHGRAATSPKAVLQWRTQSDAPNNSESDATTFAEFSETGTNPCSSDRSPRSMQHVGLLAPVLAQSLVF
jgi:hypothetical protein